MIRRLAFVVGLLAALPAAVLAQAPSIGVVTIVDGVLMLQRGGERFAAAEGQRVQADDLLTTSEPTRVARVELDDGKTLDLGPATQLLLQPRALAADDDGGVTAMLVRGWLKLSAPWNLTTPAALASPRLDAQRVRGVVIAQADKAEGWLYVESGIAAAQPRDGRRAAPYALAEGGSFTQRADGGLQSTANPVDRLARMPRAFFDTLPRRAARFGVPPPAAAPLAALQR
jgi:hypothetical protein